MYIKVAKYFTVIWLVILVAYIGLAPELFRRMFPHEVGELLAGWFAPLAAIWVGAAVVLQREQLSAQQEEIAHASEALRLQSVELQRAIEDVKRHDLKARTERLLDRLSSSVRRIVQAAEYCELHDEYSTVAQAKLSGLLGTYQSYTELLQAKEIDTVLKRIGIGMDQFVQRVGKGWLLKVSFKRADELCLYLGSLSGVVMKLRELPLTDDERETLGVPVQARLEQAGLSISTAENTLADILKKNTDLEAR